MFKALIYLILFFLTILQCKAQQTVHLCFAANNDITYLPSMKKDMFIRGYKIALNDINTMQHNFKFILKDFSRSSSPLAPIKSIKDIIQDNQCMMAIGFPTSQEALLAGKIAKDKILFVSTSGSDEDIGKIGKGIFSGVSSSKSYVSKIVTKVIPYLNLKRKKGVVIYDSSKYSKIYADYYISLMRDTEIIKFDNDNLLSDLDVKLLADADYLFITSYQFTAQKIISLLKQKNIHKIILGSPSWAFDLDLLTQQLDISYREPIYLLSPYFYKTNNAFNQEFVKKYKIIFNSSPSADVALAYDMGNIIIDQLPLIAPLSRANILRHFQNFSYKRGVTGNFIYYNYGHPQKPFYFLKVLGKEIELMEIFKYE